MATSIRTNVLLRVCVLRIAAVSTSQRELSTKQGPSSLALFSVVRYGQEFRVCEFVREKDIFPFLIMNERFTQLVLSLLGRLPRARFSKEQYGVKVIVRNRA